MLQQAVGTHIIRCNFIYHIAMLRQMTNGIGRNPLGQRYINDYVFLHDEVAGLIYDLLQGMNNSLDCNYPALIYRLLNAAVGKLHRVLSCTHHVHKVFIELGIRQRTDNSAGIFFINRINQLGH